MDEPPILIDGTRVLAYAILDEQARKSPAFRAMAAGMPLDGNAVARLVVAENLVEDGVFLIHCDDEWGTVAAETFPDAASAQAAAHEAYTGVTIEWTPFRELTEAERREVQVTRDFLREITAEFPPG
jgi:hypothetical protein